MEEKPKRMLWCGNGLGCSLIGIITNLGKILAHTDLYRITTPVAHSRHKCCECKKRIEKGQWYQLIVGLWNGEVWERFITCTDCADMRSHAAHQYQFPQAISFGGLHAHLAEEVEDALGGPGGVP